jgi:hypothetical protein
MAQSPSGPLNSRLGKYYVRLRIGEYKRPTPFSISEFNALETIYLPLPTELKDSTAVGYNSNDNLESVGDLFNGDLVTGLGALGLRNIGSVINDTVKTAAQAALTVSKFAGGKLAEAAEKSIDQVANPAQLTSAIQQSAGMAPNPNPSVTFTGPNLSEFNLSWTIYPKSASESEGLLKVIKILKRSALPENTISGASAILNYPRMVQINYFPWDSGGEGSWGWTKNSIIKHKKCVMTRVDVSYTPGGAPGFFHETNGPVAATILISFQEIEYMLSKDWEGGDGLGFDDIISRVVTAITNIGTLPVTAPIDAVNAVGNGIGEVGTGVGEAGVAVAQGVSESRAAQLVNATLGNSGNGR